MLTEYVQVNSRICTAIAIRHPEVTAEGRKYLYRSGINIFTHSFHPLAPAPEEDQPTPASPSVPDPTLNPAAGTCVTCPRRSGYNTSLFSDVTDGDHCLSGPCYQIKLANHIDREIAARPELIQIENGWRNAREQRPGAVQRGHFREIETVVENPDAEPAPPCAAAKPASMR
jgi:hypothetical protein